MNIKMIYEMKIILDIRYYLNRSISPSWEFIASY